MKRFYDQIRTKMMNRSQQQKPDFITEKTRQFLIESAGTTVDQHYRWIDLPILSRW